MTSALGSIVIFTTLGTLGSGSAHSDGGYHAHGHLPSVGRILRPGPGNGWGFPNGARNGYGYINYEIALPLGADRTADYFFPRYFAVTGPNLVFPNYYNPYVDRGQRYLPFAGQGGFHPLGQVAVNHRLPYRPYLDAAASGPVVTVPGFGGRVEAPPTDSSTNDLMP
jgi:hypothetical protein